VPEKTTNKISSFKKISMPILFGLILAGIFCSTIYVLATDWPYMPGATLDPACSPIDTDCKVQAPLTNGFTNNFSGSGNFATTGTVGGGAITGTSFTIGSNTISSFSNLSAFSSLANSAGVLRNNGSGGLTWDPATGMVNPMDAAGQMIYGGNAGAGTKLAAGSAGQVLRVNSSGNPGWSTATYPLTAGTSGTIFTSNGSDIVNTTATYPSITTAEQLLYSTDANAIGGSAGLTFNGNTLSVTSTSTAQQKLIYDSSNYATMTTNSAGNLTIATATGTTGGDIVFTPSVTGNPQLLSDSGTLTLGSSKTSGNDENLSFDFETAADTVGLGSGSGVTNITWAGNITMGGATTVGTLVTSVFAGVPTDTNASNGSLIVDSTDGRIYVRYNPGTGSVWKYAALNTSFQIPAGETIDPISGEQMKEGDIVMGMVDATMSDDALHGIWVKWSSVKAQLLAEARGELAADGASGSGTVTGVTATTLLERVQNVLVTLGISVKDGVTSITTLVTKNLTADTAKVKGLEMVDKANGDIYCTWIENGEMKKAKGNCGDIVAETSTIATTSETATTAETTTTPTISAAALEETQTAIDAAQTAAATAQQAAEAATAASQQAQSAASTAQETAASLQAVSISSVASISDINVPFGSDLSVAALPSTVTVTLSDATTKSLSVTWDGGTPTYNSGTTGTYVFSGALTLPEGISNVNNLKAAASVIVSLNGSVVETALGDEATATATTPAATTETATTSETIAPATTTETPVEAVTETVSDAIQDSASSLLNSLPNLVKAINEALANGIGSLINSVGNLMSSPASFLNSVSNDFAKSTSEFLKWLF